MDNNDLATKRDLAELETRIVDRLTELIRNVETQLLTAFHGYGKGQAAVLNKGPNN
jgi:hypothetical protein